MTEQHPITPPPELVLRWLNCDEAQVYEDWVAIEAARWGADQELKACCEWMLANARFLDAGWIERLRTARRPKPPSLKEQALEALASADGPDYPVVATVLTADQHALIRRALEQLDD